MPARERGRAISGPASSKEPYQLPFALVSMSAAAVPPADEEPPRLVLTEEARLLPAARRPASDQRLRTGHGRARPLSPRWPPRRLPCRPSVPTPEPRARTGSLAGADLVDAARQGLRLRDQPCMRLLLLLIALGLERRAEVGLELGPPAVVQHRPRLWAEGARVLGSQPLSTRDFWYFFGSLPSR